MYVYTHILFLASGPPMCLAVFSLPANLWYPKGAWIPYLTTNASIYEHSFFPYMCFRMVFFHVCVFSANASMDSTLEPQGKSLFFFCGACQSHGCFARFNWPEKCVYVKSVSKKKSSRTVCANIVLEDKRGASGTLPSTHHIIVADSGDEWMPNTRIFRKLMHGASSSIQYAINRTI
jgi:hypothetical protein